MGSRNTFTWLASHDADGSSSYRTQCVFIRCNTKFPTCPQPAVAIEQHKSRIVGMTFIQSVIRYFDIIESE